MPLRLHLRLAAEEPLRDLRLRHLECEERNRDLVPKREVRRHAETERRLSHAGTSGDDDEVSGLEAGRQPIEVAEAGGGPGDVGAGFVQGGDALEALFQQLLDVAELRGDAALRKLEDDLLGTVDENLRLARAFPTELGDLLSGDDEAAEGRHLVDDARVVRRICRRWHERCQLVHPHAPADGLELATFLELVDEGDRVDRLAFRIEREARAIDLRVALPVEVGGIEDLAHRSDRTRGEQHRPENRLLGLEVLGWRNRSGFCELGDRCHSVGVNHPCACVSICGNVRSRHVFFASFAAEKNICSHTVRTEPVDGSTATSGNFFRKSTGRGKPCEWFYPGCPQKRGDAALQQGQDCGHDRPGRRLDRSAVAVLDVGRLALFFRYARVDRAVELVFL